MRICLLLITIGILSSCSPHIPATEIQRVSDICDKNDGIETYYLVEGNGGLNKVAEVRCKDGAQFNTYNYPNKN